MRDLLSILKPNHPLLTSPNCIRSLIIPITVTEGIANPIPSDPPVEPVSYTHLTLPTNREV